MKTTEKTKKSNLLKIFVPAIGCSFLISCGGYQNSNVNLEKKPTTPEVAPESNGGGGGGAGGAGGVGGGAIGGAFGIASAPQPAAAKGPIQNTLVSVREVPMVPRSLTELEADFDKWEATPFQVIEIKNLVKEELQVEFTFGTSTTPLKATWQIEVAGPKSQRTLDTETKTIEESRNLLVSGIGSSTRFDRDIQIPQRSQDLKHVFALPSSSPFPVSGTDATIRFSFYATLEGKRPRDKSERVTVNAPDKDGKVQVKSLMRTEKVKSAQVSGSAAVMIHVIRKDGTKVCVYGS